MQERIDRMRVAVAEMRKRAATCDSDFHVQFLSLAYEMQDAIDEMQQKLDAMTASAQTPDGIVAEEQL